ncbi:MAG TPA: DUF1028 domain-containing protein [Acidimicrobiales bacterium]|nr:DUF1028 domain-containing protein [Acidimicrobiales bacterium]
MTYSIVARDPDTGQMGVATQSQAFAVGASVPWAAAGVGVVATQSMGEPMYGDLGVEALRAGLTATEVLRALRSVDPHPERRQVAIVDTHAGIEVYTGDTCVAAAGHALGDGCAALANIVHGPEVWEAMVAAYHDTGGRLSDRLMAALHAGEDAGGDDRGTRSAAILVVQAERSGRPWRDTVVDLRVDDAPDPLGRLDRMVVHNQRYHETVAAFELALDGDPATAVDRLPDATSEGAGGDEPGPSIGAGDADLVLWRAIVLALAGRTGEAARLGDALTRQMPQAAEVARRFGDAGLVDPALLARILPR